MTSLGLDHSGRRRGAGAALVLAVTLAIIFTGGGQVLHLHQASTPGFYNERHVLESLAALSPDVPLPEALPAVGLAPIATAAAIATDPLVCTPAARHAGPRAPPTV